MVCRKVFLLSKCRSCSAIFFQISNMSPGMPSDKGASDGFAKVQCAIQLKYRERDALL